VAPGRYGTGLINQTLLGHLAGDQVIVQRVHPAFAGRVHVDIEAVTSHLADKGLVTPRLVRTVDGALWQDDAEGRAWRVLTFVEGTSRERLGSPAEVEEAARLVGSFHAALADLSHAYVHTRPGIHDVPFRVAALEAAVDLRSGHRLHGEVARLAEEMLAVSGQLLPLGATPARHAHGDLKASNLLFDEAARGVCLVDLDTVSSMMWPFELGDAVRSWCNPGGEDLADACIDEERFAALVAGYRRGARGVDLDALEIELLPRGAMTIACELAIRFATDALEEVYFGWDRARFAARGEHNLRRARGQWALARSIGAALARLEAMARTLG
jgi:Ser/Thr protein kinase RdoA (MazF antagonist)